MTDKIETPDPADSKPNEQEQDVGSPTLSDKSFVIFIALLSLSACVGLGFIISYFINQEDHVTQTNKINLFAGVFFILLCIAMFLSIIVGEKTTVTLGSITLIGTSSALAGLLFLFNNSMESFFKAEQTVSVLRKVEIDCPFVENAELDKIENNFDLILALKGDKSYIDNLRSKFQSKYKNSPRETFPFLEQGKHPYLSLKKHYIIREAAGEKGFFLPSNFRQNRTVDIVLASRQPEQTDEIADRPTHRKLLSFKIMSQHKSGGKHETGQANEVHVTAKIDFSNVKQYCGENSNGSGDLNE
jgi:hypothetical protein